MQVSERECLKQVVVPWNILVRRLLGRHNTKHSFVVQMYYLVMQNILSY